MADPSRRLSDNVAGDFFVDATCIDCGTCRWVAPASFGRGAGGSRVKQQPVDAQQTRRAQLAQIACPTASIGRVERGPLPVDAFPDDVGDGVLHCGYHDEATFGAASWLVPRPEGNVLVDVPRFSTPLVKAIERRGGVRTIFLTHRDDVGDHGKWAERFGATRVIHARDAVPGVERLLEGDDDVVLQRGVTAIPTPGHTRGSTCLLVDDRVLFTGDHVAYDARNDRLYAFDDACWFSWDVQKTSVAKLARYRFARVLPGHGRPGAFDAARMRDEVIALAARM